MSDPGARRLLHRTVYDYGRAVRLGPQWVRLRPMPDPRGPEPSYALTVTPAPLSLHWQMDPEGNRVARMVLPPEVERLTLEVSVGVPGPRNPFDFLLDPSAEAMPFTYAPATAAALARYMAPDPAEAGVQALADEAGPVATVEWLLALTARVRDRLEYVVREEPGVWSPGQTLAEGRGSCRDSAWLLVQALRLRGVAARFVSGYLVQEEGAELHAWAEAYLPGAGWVGVDATSGFLTAEQHIGLAAATEPGGAAPLEGTVEPGPVHLTTSVQVVAA